jgi:hypothetical protein
MGLVGATEQIMTECRGSEITCCYFSQRQINPRSERRCVHILFAGSLQHPKIVLCSDGLSRLRVGSDDEVETLSSLRSDFQVPIKCQ